VEPSELVQGEPGMASGVWVQWQTKGARRQQRSGTVAEPERKLQQTERNGSKATEER